MAALGLLADYNGGGSDGEEEQRDDELSAEKMMEPIKDGAPSSAAKALVALPSINAAPLAIYRDDGRGRAAVEPGCKEISLNLKYEELFAPVAGPSNPFKTDQQKAHKNTLTGFVEAAHFNPFHFEKERQTFDTHGYARDPSADIVTAKEFVGDAKLAKSEDGATVFESSKKTGLEKRKRDRNWDPADVEGYLGPWGKYKNEETVSKPDEKTLKEMEAFAQKRKKLSKKKKKVEEAPVEEKSTLHIKDPNDYQGRSFMHAPHDVGVNLRNEEPPNRCYIPKKQLHTYVGHTKGVQCIRWFPKTAHLLLSGGMDCKMKLWEVYKNRRCIRSYMGHRMAIKDCRFNNLGTEIASVSYDRYTKIWDTETGQCKTRLTTGKVPFCVRFNPDDDKQHFLLTGMQDKKVIQWDLRSGEIAQEYDRHLGAVNTITFFDNNRRFCTTSDDKSMRIWEWEIPVDTKLIQDAGMHSMPTVTMSPNNKWLVGQSMDNKIILFQMMDEKLRFAKKKAFRGHTSAGYACQIGFSPEMSYIMCGDSDGRLFIWDWKNHKIAAKWKAHDNVCIGALWHPHETSKIATCGWDNMIKLWD